MHVEDAPTPAVVVLPIARILHSQRLYGQFDLPGHTYTAIGAQRGHRRDLESNIRLSALASWLKCGWPVHNIYLVAVWIHACAFPLGFVVYPVALHCANVVRKGPL
eukprot:6116318-Pyramimonas_sp.AAC.1